MGKHTEQTALTRKSIEDAFWAIAGDGRALDISISAIAKRAGINRSTFYEYFNGIEDLVNQVEETILSELKQVFGDLYVKYNLNCSPRDMANALSPYYGRMAILMRFDGDRRFSGKIRREAVDLFSGITTNPDPMIEYEIVYVVSAFIGLLSYWQETGRAIDEDEFTNIVHTMSIRGLSGQCTDAKPSRD